MVLKALCLFDDQALRIAAGGLRRIPASRGAWNLDGIETARFSSVPWIALEIADGPGGLAP